MKRGKSLTGSEATRLTESLPRNVGSRQLVILADAEVAEDRVARLVARLRGHLDVPVVQEGSELDPSWLLLHLAADGLSLEGDGLVLRADLSRMLPRLKPANLQRELLVRAARLKGFEGVPIAVDATAGLGEDSLLLAAAGFEVTLFERDPVIAALLADALERAASSEVPQLVDAVCRMRLVEGDSLALLPSLTARPDVVYLDPMFPGRTKSAAVKKKFQLLHYLEAPCADERELLAAALASGPRRVVIKRPPKGPHLAGVKPSYSLAGKAVRYDCIAVPGSSRRASLSS